MSKQKRLEDNLRNTNLSLGLTAAVAVAFMGAKIAQGTQLLQLSDIGNIMLNGGFLITLIASTLFSGYRMGETAKLKYAMAANNPS